MEYVNRTLPVVPSDLNKTGLWGGGLLARAAQQRQRLGAQRTLHQQNAGKGEEESRESKGRKHGFDYIHIIPGVQDPCCASPTTPMPP